jgi:ADP-ribose pyrophosphatase YjhB (NUDIX family)
MMTKAVLGLISRPTKDHRRKYLLVRSKKKRGKYTDFYYPPGGHLKKDEDEKVGLVREIREELKAEILPLKKIATTPGDFEDITLNWWLCQAQAENLTAHSDAAEICWLTKEEILKSKKIWPATKKFFKNYSTFLTFPE